MSCFKVGLSVFGSSDFDFKNTVKGLSRTQSLIQTLQSETLCLSNQKPFSNILTKSPKLEHLSVNASMCTEKTLRWWEKSLHPNMIEIGSAQELVDSLLNAGDRLVVVDFYSPECGGCRTLHPKICQVSEMNCDVLFLRVNHENHMEMCYALNIHVLPFFRFYRGPEGKACSFSCTNATIQKFKDAMAKHKFSSRCLGSATAKGLDESELSALASLALISRNPVPKDDRVGHFIPKQTGVALEFR